MIYSVITWACHGIGRGILEETLNTLSDGEKVLVLDKDKNELDLLKNNENVIVYPIDLSNIEEITEFQRWFLAQGVSCKHLVNNAWVQCGFDLLNPEIGVWNDVLGLNLTAPLLLSSFFAKQFIQDDIQGHSIINITSIHDSIINEKAPYSCSKAALKMLTKEFADKLAGSNIRVNAIAPGSTNTPMLRKDLDSEKLLDESAQTIPLWRHGTSKDIANAVLFLQSDKASYITGETLVIDWWLSLVI